MGCVVFSGLLGIYQQLFVLAIKIDVRSHQYNVVMQQTHFIHRSHFRCGDSTSTLSYISGVSMKFLEYNTVLVAMGSNALLAARWYGIKT